MLHSKLDCCFLSHAALIKRLFNPTPAMTVAHALPLHPAAAREQASSCLEVADEAVALVAHGAKVDGGATWLEQEQLVKGLRADASRRDEAQGGPSLWRHWGVAMKAGKREAKRGARGLGGLLAANTLHFAGATAGLACGQGHKGWRYNRQTHLENVDGGLR